jgi:Ser/Thr protein kinase RdoA (MazF antagonist)
VDLQPCLRDIWHDHVLFTRDRVTGLVDFGALRDECVVGDVARLLASLVRGDQAAWELGLTAYQQHYPLDCVQQDLLVVFHHTTALLSGMNWLRWIYLEGRVFDWPDRILARIDEHLNDLKQLRPP